jgi:hypothetical protein
MARWSILFLGSAVFTAAAMYIVAHDMAAICRSTIEINSMLGAATLGGGWLVATIRDVMKSWL